MHLDRRAHLDERVGEAEAVLVDRLVHDRHALGLRERDDERLLPVGHEAGVHVGLDDDRLQLAARVEEADAVVARSRTPPTLRNTLRNVSISGWRAPPTKMSPSVASAAAAQLAASLRSKSARWS